MLSSLKKYLSILLVVLLVASPLEAVFASAMGSSGDAQCTMDMNANGMQHQDHHSDQTDDHQQHEPCTQGKCSHTICATSVFSTNTNPFMVIPHLADSRINDIYSLQIANYPTSLYRPPRA